MTGSNSGEKTAIILLGHGMRSAHGAGFLYALATELNIKQPDIILGSSGNAGNVLYYTAGQYEFLKRAWTKLLSTPCFISFWRLFRIMDVDYLIDVVFKEQVPLETKALALAHTEYYIPLTDALTNEKRYVSRDDSVDPFELLRAAKAIPFFYRKKVHLLGRLYKDWEFGSVFIQHVKKILSLGTQRIVIVNDGPEMTKFNSLTKHLRALIQSGDLQNATLREVNKNATHVAAKNISMLCIQPSPLSIHALTRDQAKLTRGFETGIQDAVALENELHAILSI